MEGVGGIDPEFEQRKMAFYLAVAQMQPANGEDSLSMGSVGFQNLDEGVQVGCVDRDGGGDEEVVDDASSQASSLFMV